MRFGTEEFFMVLALMAVAGLGLFGGAAAALLLAAGVLMVVVLAGVTRWAQFGGAFRPNPIRDVTEPENEGMFSVLEGLMGLALASIALRLVLVMVVNGTPLWRSFGPDALTWERYGHIALAYWQNPSVLVPDWVHRIGSVSFFSGLNGVSVWLFGSSRYPVSFLNALIGVLVAFTDAMVAYRVFNRAAARRTFVLVLFYPSLLLWSTMNLREVWAHGALLLVLLAGHNARTRFDPVSLVLLLGSLFFLYLIRPYLLGITLAAVLLSMVIVKARHIPSALVGGGALLTVMALYGERLGLRTELISADSLLAIQELRQGLAYGGSAYGADVDTSTWIGSLLYLPEGVTRFLFAPFPWAVRSWQQALALPESLLFAVFVFQATRQIFRDLFRDPSRIILPLSTLVFLTCAYGLVSGNEGTAFRHRAQAVVIVLMFAAADQVRGRQKAASPPAAAQDVDHRLTAWSPRPHPAPPV